MPLAEDVAQTGGAAAPQSGVQVLQQAATSQTTFEASTGQRDGSELLRALTASSAVLARKNAKLRDNRDRLQVEACLKIQRFNTCTACEHAVSCSA